MGMGLMKNKWLWMRRGFAVCALAMTLAAMAMAQAVSTTTVQGTVYLANGQPGAGTLLISWPSFTTAAGQAVAADSITVAIGTDGFVSVNLAANLGAAPAGEFYTAVYDMSDGTTSTQYWVVPAAANASLAAVQAQVMPAAQAVQTVSKAYVDEAIAELSASSGLSASGGTLTGPLYLSGDPTQPLQAADKHYVDTQVATAVPLAGGNMTGALTTPTMNGVQAPAVASAQTTLQAAMTAAGTNGAMVIPPTYAGTDTFTNANGVKVTDLRSGGAQQAERSVKEFGAVCDSVTDDTNALQAALTYANAHGVALTIPQGTCKTRPLSWHGESIGGLGKQVSALMGFPGQDVLQSGPDATNMLSYTRLHDLTIYVDQSEDVSCSPAEGRAAAGSCQESRPMEANSIFSPGGSGLTGTAGTGAAWSVGNCAIAMQAATGTGGNGLRVAEMENVEIATTGTDPMAAQFPGAHSTHTCGLYLAQWPQWSEFRNIDIRGLNTGVAIPALPVTAPAGLNADSNRWQNVTIQATHAFTAAAGSNNVLDNVVALAGNSSATGEPPTGLVLDLSGTSQGWTVRNAVVAPAWNAVAPALTLAAAGGAVTAVTLGSEHGLGWDPYGVSVPVTFSGSCTAQANAAVNTSGAISGVTVTQGGVGCSTTTTASLNAAGTWDTAAPVNLIGGQNMTFFAGNLLKGNGGYTVWNAGSSASYGTQLDSGGGMLPGGGAYAALAGSGKVGSAFQVDQFPGMDIGAKIQACVNAVNASYGGTCDARNFTGNLTIASTLTISTGNVSILLPCATITTANQIVVMAGTRNVALRGCALRGGSQASGSTGGTALAYTGSSSMVAVGDPTYAVDTPGFHMDNVVINTTAATSATAQGLVVYRTQELDLESLYFLGNSNQTGMTLDGTGNYTGGTFFDNQFSGFGTAINAIGHQVTNPATTDWMNASTFVRLHIDCPTSGGSPISGTYGINLQQGDGNTFTGGDVESCSTALHLGPNAQNNTIVGLRNENSTSQVVADAGSSYNNWMTGGTMFTGKLTDNGTRNSFLDTFHRSFNELNGDWYLSQQDATLTNHFRLGIGAGNERGLLNEIQTDYGYRWLYGFSDAAGGQQLYQMDDLLNNVYRLQIQQWNPGQSSTNNETALNAAGTGNVCFNCSTNSGTGGVTFASGGTTPTAVATVDKLGDAQFVGNLLVGGTTQSTGTLSLRNSADAEVDYYLWPGLTTSQKGSFTYKDWNGNSQWYLVKDASNNWELNSATGGLDSFKAYQSTNTGDTYIDASNSTGHVRLNYETGSGAETDIYSGSGTSLDAAFLAPNAIKFPGLAASSGDFCLQIDNSGYITNTGSPCGTGSGSGGGSGTINSGSSGQIAYYTTSGTVIGGVSAVPLASGGTGATSASTAIANLLPGVASDSNHGITVQGNAAAAQSITTVSPMLDIRAYGATIDGTTDIATPLQNAIAACPQPLTGTGGNSCTVLLSCGGKGCYLGPSASSLAYSASGILQLKLQGNLALGTTLVLPDGTSLVGDGGGTNTEFQNKGPDASISGPDVSGTLGTAIAAANAPVTFTPSFTAGNIADLPVNSAITIAGLTSCTASVTRSTGAYLEQYVATCSAYTRIPPDSLVTVAGCSDSSFNVMGTPVIASDYTAQTIGWQQPLGASPGTATGCTVTGFNDDSFETVRITAESGSTVTATFAHTHSANDQWGMVAIAPPWSTYGHHDIENIATTGCLGACFWAEHDADINLSNDGFQATEGMTSIPVEMDSSWWFTMNNDSLGGFADLWFGGCTSNCTQTSYPQSLRCTQLESTRNGAGDGACGAMSQVQDSTISGGIKTDMNGVTSSTTNSLTPPALQNIIIEQPTINGITIDNRYASPGAFIADNVFLQDASLALNGGAYVGYTDKTGSSGSGWVAGGQGGYADIRELSNLVTTTIVNSYYSGRFKASPTSNMTLPIGRNVPVGVMDDGGVVKAELDGTDAGFGPSVIPFSTLSATTSPSIWTFASGSGTITTGVRAPDGTMNAGEIVATSAGNNPVTVGAVNQSTASGDRFIVGVWVRAGTNETTINSFWGGAPYYLQSGGTDTFVGGLAGGTVAASTSFGMTMRGDWWHPVIALFTIATGEATAHSINFNLEAPVISGQGNQFFQPFWIYIPASANIPLDEVERWRQQLMHGYVPSGLASSGGVLAMSPSHELYWGNDTNLYRGATGVVQTDGAINAVSGYKVNGAALGTANLADWTDSGAANGLVPMWNSTTNKWTPGAQSGGTVSDGSGATTSPEFAESTSVAHTIQYRTPAQALLDMGAAAAQGNAPDETSSWSFSTTGPYRVNCSTGCTGTLQSTISTGFMAAVNNVGTATVTIAGGGPTLVCSPVVACTIPPGGNGLVYTDGTGWYLIDGGNATEINGGVVPASAAVIATNSSAQPVNAATTGSGSVVLATSPSLSGPSVSGTLAGASETLSGTLNVNGAQTLTGATTMQGNVTLENGANSNQTLAIQPGSSAEQIGAVQFNSYTGTAEWQLRKDASNNLRVTDAVNSLDRMILPANANTTINAGAGANAVAINNTSGSGTSGFIVYEGGTNNSTAAFQVSGSGNTTATGYLQGKFIMGTGTMGVAAGAAAGSSPTIACATSHVCDGVSGTVTLTIGTSPATGTLATLNFPNTHTNQANCMVSTLSATGMVTSNTWAESTTAITITANTALTASTAYTIKYWCGSY
jgi:hypothetical protein